MEKGFIPAKVSAVRELEERSKKRLHPVDNWAGWAIFADYLIELMEGEARRRKE